MAWAQGLYLDNIVDTASLYAFAGVDRESPRETAIIDVLEHAALACGASRLAGISRPAASRFVALLEGALRGIETNAESARQLAAASSGSSSSSSSPSSIRVRGRSPTKTARRHAGYSRPMAIQRLLAIAPSEGHVRGEGVPPSRRFWSRFEAASFSRYPLFTQARRMMDEDGGQESGSTSQ